MKQPPRKKQPPAKPSLTATFQRKANDIVNAEEGHTRLIQAILKNDRDMTAALLEAGAKPDIRARDGRAAIHIAAAEGHDWAVTLLARHNANMNIQDKEKKTAFFHALSSKDPALLVTLLSVCGASADIADADGKLPLHYAAEKSAPDTVKFLTEKTMHPDKADKLGFQPLHYACQSNTLGVVQALVNARVPLDAATLKGDSCLHLALERRDTAVSEYLLKTEAVSLVNASNLDGRTPLHLAVANKKNALVTTLIKKGADPNAADRESRTPLYEAAKENDVKMARKLIALGADVAVRQKSGTETPLMAAINNKYPLNEMVQLLLDNNAEVNATDKNGYTALMLAAYKGHEGICGKLLDKKADASKTDFLGRNALHYMDGTLPASLVKRLVAAGADINQPESFQKRSPLMMALQDHKVSAAHALIDAGADINLQNQNGHTALFYALKGNHTDVAKKLLDKKADITLGEFGTKVTPLHLAAQQGHHEIFEKMVRLGADPEMKDASGSTPLHHALLNGLASIQIIFTILKCGGSPTTPNDKGFAPYDYAYSDNRTIVTSIFDDHLRKQGKPKHMPKHPPRRFWWGGY